MKINLVDAKGVAPSVGPYSHAVTLDDLVFVSGNVGIDSKAQLVSSNVVDQTMQAFLNIRVVLEASGSKISDIVKTRAGKLMLSTKQKALRVDIVR